MDTSPIFNNIASEYDRFNHLFSMNIDKSWRRSCVRCAYEFALERAASKGACLSSIKVLDLACGTGDLSIMLAEKGLSVTGADISEGMLNVGRSKIEALWRKNKYSKCPKPELLMGDGASLSFEDNTFDIVTIGYGIRNFDDRPASLKEILRVLSHGGALLILEFAQPRNAFVRMLYKPYFHYIIPAMASLLTKGRDKEAYRYFIKSVENFPKFEMFCRELSEAGFEKEAYKCQTGGISVLYRASKPML